MNNLFNGVMLDAGRCLERPDYYRRVIDFAADRGLTRLLFHFSDDQGFAIEFASVPGIASPHAMSGKQLRSLLAYASERGIEVIPELASLGHAGYLTRLPQYRHLAESDQMFSSLCPVAPETRPLIAALLQETCDLFDSSAVHAGLDETNFGYHPLSAAALKTRTRTEIFADHIEFIHALLTHRGRTMWMWADGLLHDDALADRLPRDIVQCNWRYRPEEPTDTSQSLIDRGYPVVLCSASISSQQLLFPGEQFALPNIRSLRTHESLMPSSGAGRVIGKINTIWTPVRYIAESLWLGLDLAFALMREGPAIDIGDRIDAFGVDFYGLSDLPSWRAACETVLRRSPLRDEWLAAINMRPGDGALCETIRAAAPQWNLAARQLEAARPGVRRHAREFDAFLLMVRLAETAYTLASRIPHLSPDEAEHAAGRWQAMIRAVDAQWDAERYADDPRKYAAPIKHFDGDHLIPNMQRGLEELQARSRAAQPLAAE